MKRFLILKPRLTLAFQLGPFLLILKDAALETRRPGTSLTTEEFAPVAQFGFGFLLPLPQQI